MQQCVAKQQLSIRSLHNKVISQCLIMLRALSLYPGMCHAVVQLHTNILHGLHKLNNYKNICSPQASRKWNLYIYTQLHCLLHDNKNYHMLEQKNSINPVICVVVIYGNVYKVKICTLFQWSVIALASIICNLVRSLLDNNIYCFISKKSHKPKHAKYIHTYLKSRCHCNRGIN